MPILMILQGEPRLLLFSPDSRTLYFTTTLSTCVQAYSIPSGELLPPLPPHPSPPNTLAVSSDGYVLLSASPTPPTIYLQDRLWGASAAVSFHPTDSHSSATCAAFRTLEASTSLSCTTFVLGFQDGALAMYRLPLQCQSNVRQASNTDHTQAFQLQPVRIGAIRKLHKGSMGGVIAAEFIPGYKFRIVSIGHDGRCRLVDLEEGAKVLRT